MSSAIANYVLAFFLDPFDLPFGATSSGSGWILGLPRGRLGGAFMAAVTRFSIQRGQRQRGYLGTCFDQITPPEKVRRFRLLRRPFSERKRSSGIVVRSQSSLQATFNSSSGVINMV